MKILLLAPHSYYVERGTPIDVDLLLRALSARGEEVHALVYPAGQDRTYPGVTIQRIRAPRWIGDVGPGLSLKKLICDLYMIPAAWRLARSQRFDLIHADEEAAFIALVLRMTMGLPYVYDMDSSIAQQVVEKVPLLRPLSPLFNYLERLLVRRSIAVAPVCRALADLAVEHGAAQVVTLDDISQLANPDSPRTGELQRRFGVEGTVVMYVGNLEPYQGIDLLLDAFKHAAEQERSLQLVVAGGSDRDIERYRARVSALGLSGRAHLIGRWPADKLHELLAEADILTVPRTKGINTPMKVFPFLHSGKPVLVTDLPTHTQILTDRVAALAPAEPVGFANVLLGLARDPEWRDELGRAGRAFVEAGHTYEAHRQRLNRLYDYVVGCLQPKNPGSSLSRTRPAAPALAETLASSLGDSDKLLEERSA